MSHLIENISRIVPMLVLSAMVAFAGCNGDQQAGEYENEDTVSYQQGDPIDDDNLAIIVSSEYGADTLYTEEFQQQFQQIQQQAPQYGLGPGQENEMRRILVESFVGQHVLDGEATARGLEPDAEMIEMQLQQARGQFESDEQFQQMLEAEGLSEDDVRRMIADQMRQQMLQEELAEDATDPTDEEIEEFRTRQTSEVRARHILFMTQNGNEEEQRQQAEAVLDSIQAGADFAEMAQRHSDDGTAEDGGDLGYFSRERMVPEFSEAAFALADSGDVTSEPVRTDFGYHIIQKTGEREAEPMAEEEARRTMMQERRGEALDAAFHELRSKATVRINPNVVEGVDLSEDPDVAM